MRPERRDSLAAAPTATASVTGYAPGNYVETLVVNQQVRQYRLHIPPTHKPDQAMPLVVNLHGFASSAAEQERLSQMSVKADQIGFIVVYPEGLGTPQTWHIGSRAAADADLQFIRNLIVHLKTRLNIARDRIYATGISNGAQMANRLGCEMADVFAAIAPVSGGYFPSQECRPVRPVAVVAFHGTADRILPYEGRGRILLPVREWAADWATRNGCDSRPAITFQHGEVKGETWGRCRKGAEVVLYTIQGRGHSWPGSSMPSRITTQDVNATDVIWEFFASHPML